LDNEPDKENTNGESLNKGGQKKGTTSHAVEEYKIQKKIGLTRISELYNNEMITAKTFNLKVAPETLKKIISDIETEL
jgi:hypothetical protein